MDTSHSSGRSSSPIVIASSVVNDSTGKTNETGHTIHPENNTQSVEYNNGTTESDVEQTPEQKNNTSVPPKRE